MTEEQPQANINEIQRLHFELFRRVRYNFLDGERVVRDLLEWHDLWYSVLPTRFPHYFNTPDDKQYHPYTELSMLRHARWESWPADTLSIWTNDQALPHLRQRIEERLRSSWPFPNPPPLLFTRTGGGRPRGWTGATAGWCWGWNPCGRPGGGLVRDCHSQIYKAKCHRLAM